MIMRFVILRRKPGMTVDAFKNYWQTVYGPNKTDGQIDGIAELWFKSEESQKKAWNSPEYQAVLEDEPNLFEMNSHSVHSVMTDKIVVIKG